MGQREITKNLENTFKAKQFLKIKQTKNNKLYIMR